MANDVILQDMKAMASNGLSSPSDLMQDNVIRPQSRIDGSGPSEGPEVREAQEVNNDIDVLAAQPSSGHTDTDKSVTEDTPESSNATAAHIVESTRVTSERIIDQSAKGDASISKGISELDKSIDSGFAEQHRLMQGQTRLLTGMDRTMSDQYDLMWREANKIEPTIQESAWGRGEDSTFGDGTKKSNNQSEEGSFFSSIGELILGAGAGAAAGKTILGRDKGDGKKPNAKGKHNTPKARGAKGKLIASVLGGLGLYSLVNSEDEYSEDTVGTTTSNVYADENIEQARLFNEGLPEMKGQELIDFRSAITLRNGYIPDPNTGFPVSQDNSYNTESHVQKANALNSTVMGASVFMAKYEAPDVDLKPSTVNKVVSVKDAASDIASKAHDKIKAVKGAADRTIDSTVRSATRVTDALDNAVSKVTTPVSNVITTTVDKALSPVYAVVDKADNIVRSGEERLVKTKDKIISVAKQASDNAKTKVVDATQRTASKATTAIKGSAPRSAGVLDNTIANVSKTLDATKTTVTKVVDSTTNLVDVTKTKLTSVVDKAGEAIKASDNVLVKTTAPVMKGLSKGAMKAVPFAGTALGAYDTFNIVTDDTVSTEDKSLELAKLAGGTVGSIGGMTAGAGIGASIGAGIGSIVPVVGTAAGAAVGGIIGGIGGAITGYFGGDSIVDLAHDKLSEAVEEYDLADSIGRAVAVPMALFDSNAREALVSDFNNNLVPKLTEFKDGVLDFFGFADDVELPEKPDEPIVEQLVAGTSVTTYPDGTSVAVTDTSNVNKPVVDSTNTVSDMFNIDTNPMTVMPMLSRASIDVEDETIKTQNIANEASIKTAEQLATAATSNSKTTEVRKQTQLDRVKSSIENRKIQHYVSQVRHGVLDISNVPENIRSEVSQKLKAYGVNTTVAQNTLTTSHNVLFDSETPATDNIIEPTGVQAPTGNTKHTEARSTPSNNVVLLGDVKSNKALPNTETAETLVSVQAQAPNVDKDGAGTSMQTVSGSDVVREKHEQVSKVMMIEPTIQKSANTNTKQKENSNTPSSGSIGRSTASKPSLSEVPTVVSDFGLVMLNTGFI